MTAPEHGATFDEALSMVTDLYEVGLIDDDPAAAILSDHTGLSPGLCGRILGHELGRRDREAAARDRAAEQAMRNDDGTWSP